MFGNQKARIRKAIAIGIQMIRVSMAFLEDTPTAIAGAIETAMMTNAMRTSHGMAVVGRFLLV